MKQRFIFGWAVALALEIFIQIYQKSWTNKIRGHKSYPSWVCHPHDKSTKEQMWVSANEPKIKLNLKDHNCISGAERKGEHSEVWQWREKVTKQRSIQQILSGLLCNKDDPILSLTWGTIPNQEKQRLQRHC